MFRMAGTAALLGMVGLRVFRNMENWESIARFYGGGDTLGSFWKVIGAGFFLGPFLTTLLALAPLWLRRDAAVGLGAASACAAAFFTLEEGLIVFARSVNGSSAYVGAEPLLSAAVCGISIVTACCAGRAGRKKR